MNYIIRSAGGKRPANRATLAYTVDRALEANEVVTVEQAPSREPSDKEADAEELASTLLEAMAALDEDDE